MESVWAWLTTPPAMGEILGPFAAVYLVVFAPGFVVSAYLAGPGAERLARTPVQFVGVSHWATVGLWVFGPGLFFFGVRTLQTNPLSFGEPIRLVGSVIASIVAAVRCAGWWRTVYPARLALRAPGDPLIPHAQAAKTCGTRPVIPAPPGSTARK